LKSGQVDYPDVHILRPARLHGIKVTQPIALSVIRRACEQTKNAQVNRGADWSRWRGGQRLTVLRVQNLSLLIAVSRAIIAVIHTLLLAPAPPSRPSIYYARKDSQSAGQLYIPTSTQRCSELRIPSLTQGLCSRRTKPISLRRVGLEVKSRLIIPCWWGG
jgi:hypothetical protein